MMMLVGMVTHSLNSQLFEKLQKKRLVLPPLLKLHISFPGCVTMQIWRVCTLFVVNHGDEVFQVLQNMQGFVAATPLQAS